MIGLRDQFQCCVWQHRIDHATEQVYVRQGIVARLQDQQGAGLGFGCKTIAETGLIAGDIAPGAILS